ncbi:MAG: DUF554 domain-containing protein [Sphaerochaetaceae bacterium]|nr:DUF554 domain-containing protein [Sphaerochaetaceae bacterium]
MIILNHMIATYINAIAVIIGALIGLLIGSKLSEQFKEVVFASAGLVTIVIGLQMAMQTQSFLVLLFSLVAGGAIGYALKIEKRILNLGNVIERFSSRNKKTDSTASGTSLFAVGFLNSSVLFCSGAMAVVGSIAAGTHADYNLILIKSVMDGAMAIIFAAAYGPGVLGSAVTILVYQGIFTLGGATISPLLKESGLTELSAAGGVLLIMIAFNLLGVKQFKTGNFLPALVLAPLFAALAAVITEIVPFI